MAKKQIVRLTESDLHNMIQEAVKEAINELDPRTYANYARGREAQGQNAKAWQGKLAAKNAWNKEYGENNWSCNNNGDVNSNQRHMSGVDNDYHVHNTQTTNYGDGGRYWHQDEYNPYTNSHNREGGMQNMGRQGDYSYNDQNIQGAPSQNTVKSAQGYNVARQMANGTSEYVKGQGYK